MLLAGLLSLSGNTSYAQILRVPSLLGPLTPVFHVPVITEVNTQPKLMLGADKMPQLQASIQSSIAPIATRATPDDGKAVIAAAATLNTRFDGATSASDEVMGQFDLPTNGPMDSSGREAAQSPHEYVKVMEAALNVRVEVSRESEVAHSLNVMSGDTAIGGVIYNVVPSEDAQVRTALIAHMGVDKAHRRRHIGTLLIAAMLDKNPEITQVEGALAMDNANAYRDAKNSYVEGLLSDPEKLLMATDPLFSDLPISNSTFKNWDKKERNQYVLSRLKRDIHKSIYRDSLRATPLFKSLSRFGFSNILKETAYFESSVDIVVGSR